MIIWIATAFGFAMTQVLCTYAKNLRHCEAEGCGNPGRNLSSYDYIDEL